MPASLMLDAAAPAHSAKDQPTVPVNPFVRASLKHTEPFVDSSLVINANTQQQGPFDVPAYGFLRSMVLLVQATGGVGGGATVAKKEDAPFSVLRDLTLSDVSGAPLVGPINGYDLYLINKWGAYRFVTDPALYPIYSDVAVGAAASGNFAFLLRLPVEVTSRDGLGALGNGSASSTYKLAYSIAPSTEVYSTAPATTLPTVRVRGWLEAWTLPQGADLLGRPNETQPPALGTTQFWTATPYVVNAGDQRVGLKRTGNWLRTLIFVQRNAAGTRTTTDLPDPLRVEIDGKTLHNVGRDLIRQWNVEDHGIPAASLDNGVLVLSMSQDETNKAGNERRDQWLPTTQASRIEVLGTFGNAGTMRVLTNDIAPAAAFQPTERY